MVEKWGNNWEIVDLMVISWDLMVISWDLMVISWDLYNDDFM